MGVITFLLYSFVFPTSYQHGSESQLLILGDYKFYEIYGIIFVSLVIFLFPWILEMNAKVRIRLLLLYLLILLLPEYLLFIYLLINHQVSSSFFTYSGRSWLELPFMLIKSLSVGGVALVLVLIMSNLYLKIGGKFILRK